MHGSLPVSYKRPTMSNGYSDLWAFIESRHRPGAAIAWQSCWSFRAPSPAVSADVFRPHGTGRSGSTPSALMPKELLSCKLFIIYDSTYSRYCIIYMNLYMIIYHISYIIYDYHSV